MLVSSLYFISPLQIHQQITYCWEYVQNPTTSNPFTTATSAKPWSPAEVMVLASQLDSFLRPLFPFNLFSTDQSDSVTPAQRCWKWHIKPLHGLFLPIVPSLTTLSLLYRIPSTLATLPSQRYLACSYLRPFALGVALTFFSPIVSKHALLPLSL